MLRKGAGNSVREKSSSAICPVNNILADLSSLGLGTNGPSRKTSNFIQVEFKRDSEPGKWKSSESRKREYNVTAKEINGEIFISQKILQHSVFAYERLIKLEKQSENSLIAAPNRPQICFNDADQSVKVGSKENVITDDDNDPKCKVPYEQNPPVQTALMQIEPKCKLNCEQNSPMQRAFGKRIEFSSGKSKIFQQIASIQQFMMWLVALILDHTVYPVAATIKYKEILILIGGVIGLIFATNFVWTRLFNAVNITDIDMLRETRTSLEEMLFGQHYITYRLPIDLSNFLADPSLKVGVFVLFGPSGTGKSLTSDIIQESLQNKGFVVLEWQLAGKQLPSFENVCNRFNTANSQRLVMVLEDVDEMRVSESVWEKILTQVQCKKAEKTIIIMTSTMFSAEVKDHVLKHAGSDRSGSLSKNLLTELTGKSTMLKSMEKLHQRLRIKLSILLFLFLEQEHVKMCIKKELIRRKVKMERWNELIIKSLHLMYFFENNGVRFSEAGCKLVKSRVDYVLNQ